MHDPSDVPSYELPDPVVRGNGAPATRTADWWRTRRPELLGLFAEHMYGRTPSLLPDVEYTETATGVRALDGAATRSEVVCAFRTATGRHRMTLLLYIPNHRATADRGAERTRWPGRTVIARGYGLATVYCGDLAPDYDARFGNGVHRLFPAEHGGEQGDGRVASHSWDALGAGAWGLSPALDHLKTRPEVNHAKVAVTGHSRLGKAALWAGAQDRRFAMVVSNNSGCGGAFLIHARSVVARRRLCTAVRHVFPRVFPRGVHRFETSLSKGPAGVGAGNDRSGCRGSFPARCRLRLVFRRAPVRKRAGRG
ncbi:hypothetical protein ACFVZJ_10455 [Streptomyces sp. NPDC058322]|uniref:glucuronyl esterase domain-containing protein n=1 Tax=Streptomyces sp. NPDC058322 TaxID=3346446 RepID=UPI0036E8D354